MDVIVYTLSGSELRKFNKIGDAEVKYWNDHQYLEIWSSDYLRILGKFNMRSIAGFEIVYSLEDKKSV